MSKQQEIRTVITREGADSVWNVNLPDAGAWRLDIHHRCDEAMVRRKVTVDELYQGDVLFTHTAGEEACVPAVTLQLQAGEHTLSLTGDWGQITCIALELTPVPDRTVPSLPFILNNPHASHAAQQVMAYLKTIHGKGILTGQHTCASAGAEITFLQYHTGKLPALRGFDLLGYSSAVMPPGMTPDAIVEVVQNWGTIEAALQWWQERRGLVTMCWHWYSPIDGRDKSFYTENTHFDLEAALVPGSPGYLGLEQDMDIIAGHLKRLRDAGVPILWRPLHEADGGWFWWGAKSAKAYATLYRWMYDRFTHHHGLDNLIWVWNAPEPGKYPGDDVVDISSIDIYAPAGNYGPLTASYDLAFRLANGSKAVALAENGPIPDMDELVRSRTPWLWYMTWGGGFVMDDTTTTIAQLQRVFNHPYAITSEQLPSWLFE